MSQLSRSDLCELLDVIKNDVSTWTNEDLEIDGQLRPICEHMRSACNMMWTTLTDALGENDSNDTESSDENSFDEVCRNISTGSSC
jgi:hypothetical protein